MILRLFLATICLAAASLAAEPRKPNFVFLLADDLRADALGCAGNKFAQTPHVDQLAAQGVYFANSFATDAICAPSRASFLSGQYVRRHKIDDFAKTFTVEQWAATYPALLRANGYRTGFIGKYGVGDRMPAAEFDYWRGFPGQGNFFEKGSAQHLTARMGDQAIEFLRDESPRPFCLSISFKAPHTQNEKPGQEYPVDSRDASLFVDVEIPPPPTAGERFFDLLPDFLKTSEGRRRWKARAYDDPARYAEGLRNYHRLVTGLDREVGRIRDALRERGLDRDTLIIFTSDNGYFLGGRGLVDKFFAYEESIRVPLVVFDPRLGESQRGRRLDALALNIDLAPTLLDYAGVATPPAMQGRSLRPLVEGRDTEWRREFFYEHHFRFRGMIPPSEAVRTERWKYVRFYEEQPVFEQLFDLETDPLEINNLAADPHHDATLRELREKWRKHAAELH